MGSGKSVTLKNGITFMTLSGSWDLHSTIMALIMIMAHTTGFFCIQIDGYRVDLESFVMLMEIMQGGNLI